jgi:hypothetical protein
VNCCFCNNELTQERSEIYSHCASDDCVVMWKRERLSNYSLTLVPKQGFTIVERDNVFLKVGGRSSGKSN